MKHRYVVWRILSFFLCSSAYADGVSSFGTPGLIDTPTAEVLGDGHIALTSSGFGKTLRNTFTFQLAPRVYGSFRYAVIQDFDLAVGGRDQFDRSFDIHFQLLEEQGSRPALAFGLRDFGGTGIYSSEYLVGTKTFGDVLTISGGLGWGRLAERGGFRNPLSRLSDRFTDRPDVGAGGIDTTGQLDFGAWFRGDAAFFGGVRWKVTDQASLMLEYSPDRYSREVTRGLADIKTPINVGLSYDFRNGVGLNAFVVGGSEVGVQFSYVFDPAKRRIPGGVEAAPPVLVPQSSLASASWDVSSAALKEDLKVVLKQRLAREGMQLQAMRIEGTVAEVYVENTQWNTEAQAAGRAARVLANTLALSVDTFRIIFQANGIPITSVTTKRADLYALERDFDGAWRSLARARIEDQSQAASSRAAFGVFPRFDWGLYPYLALSYFDPANPIRYELGAELSAAYQPAAGVTLATTLRYPFGGNIASASRRSDSVLPHVRSDGVLYAGESELEIRELTAELLSRPGRDVFARLSVGYLEQMFGGISGEVLWFPIDSRLALGGELNYVKQRDFDQLFGFRNYEVATGHLSAYYDFGGDFHAQLDVGRYLAGDWGATLGLDREFNNGWKVGAYFTLTDVSFDDFGEGSFDKGIRFEIPVTWFSGKPSRNVAGQVIQPVVRDGGARLNVKNRLYSVVRDYRGPQLTDGWGRYFR